MANRNQQPAYPEKMRKKWYYLVDKIGKSVSEICEAYDNVLLNGMEVLKELMELLIKNTILIREEHGRV